MRGPDPFSRAGSESSSPGEPQRGDPSRRGAATRRTAPCVGWSEWSSSWRPLSYSPLLVQQFLVKPFAIPSPSMEPTLDGG